MPPANNCRKFEPNIFNKSKCQHCFKPKELHSADALENSKASRKISKCSYLFVAPDTFDFKSPLDRTRRWQRRFIVLYDDGELTYSVDENVNTVPQGVIDMNTCTDVYDAENVTGHQFSIAVITPETFTYIKGNGKEEINRWHDVLVMYPRSHKTKHRRSPTYPSGHKSDSSSDAESPQQDAVRRSRSPSPGRRAQPDVAESRESRRVRSPTSTLLLNGKHKNETDERKMAKTSISTRPLPSSTSKPALSSTSNSTGQTASSQSSITSPATNDKIEEAPPLKKGWLVTPGPSGREWTKHWYVLSGFTLTYFCDFRAEEKGSAEGVIDLTTCKDITEVMVPRYYGFKLKKNKTEHTLSAMTSGIRASWMQAIRRNLEGSRPPSQEPVPAQESSYRGSRPTESAYPWQTGGSQTSLNTSPSPQSAEVTSWKQDDHTATSAKTETREPSEPRSHRSRRHTVDDISRPDVSASQNRQHRLSCVWPDNNQAKDRWDGKAEENQQSEVQRALQETGERGETVRSVRDDQVLDNVEKNIRRINRRSVTEFVQQHHRPQHYDKFESGSAFQEKESPKREKESPRREKIGQQEKDSSRRVSPDKQYVPTSQSEMRRYTRQQAEKEIGELEAMAAAASASTSPPVQHRRVESRLPVHHRAPSSKIKDRSRAKSPRAKSPPLKLDTSDMSDANTSDIIEQKWQEVRTVEGTNFSLQKRGTPVGAPSNSHGDGAVVELLETEVESLKAQLDSKQRQLDNVQQTNVELKAQLRLNHKDHRDSMDDMENDQGRFMSQIVDLQDKMENTTQYLQSQVTEKTHSADHSKQQAELLQSQLSRVQQTVDIQEEEINNLHAKLTTTLADLAEAEEEVKEAEAATTQAEAHLRAQIDTLNAELEDKQAEIREKNHSLNDCHEEIRRIQGYLEEKKDRIDGLEADIAELVRLRQELRERVGEVGDLSHELGMVKMQMRELDAQLQKQQREATTKVKLMEDEFYNERESLDKQMVQLRNKYEQALKQHNMADSLNSNMTDILQEKDETIAQLEEKVIEQDRRAEELSEELRVEINDNKNLQTQVEEMCIENAKIQREATETQQQLGDARREGESLQEEIEQLNMDQTDINTSKMENELFRKDLERAEKELKILHKEKDDLEQQLKQLLEKKEYNEQEQEESKRIEKQLQEMVRGLHQQMEQQEEQVHDHQNESEEWKEKHDQMAEVNKHLEESLKCSVKDFEDRNSEVTELKITIEKLRVDLNAKENDLKQEEKQKQQLQQELQRQQKNDSPASPSRNTGSQNADLQVIQQQYHDVSRRLKDTRRRLSEAEARCTELEAQSVELRKQARASEVNQEGERGEQAERIKELTSKLAATERRLHRYQRGSRPDVSEVDSEVDMSAKLQQLEMQLSATEARSSELMKRLAHQTKLETDLAMLKREQGQVKKEPIDHLASRLGQQQANSEICANKLSNVLSSWDAHVYCPGSHDLKVLISDALKSCSSVERHCHTNSLSTEQKMRLYAEQLALEAGILGGMAQCVQHQSLSRDREEENMHMVDLHQVSAQLDWLESKIMCDHTAEQSGKNALDNSDLTSFLAEKMVLQTKICALFQQADMPCSEYRLACAQDICEKLAQDIVLKTQLDKVLVQKTARFIVGDSFSPASPTSWMSSTSLMHTDLARASLKIKSAHSDTPLGTTEVVKKTCDKIQEQWSSLDGKVIMFKRKCVETIAQLMLSRDASESGLLVSKELLGKELEFVFKAYTKKECTAQINLDELSQELYGLCIAKINELEASSSTKCVSSKTNHEEYWSQLISLVEITVQWELVRTSVQRSMDPSKKSSHTPLCRNDSGIIVHGSSNPTSPIVNTQHDYSVISSRLRQDSLIKSQTADYILNNTGIDGDGDFHGEVMHLASKMIDTQLSMASSGEGLASCVAREAVRQAELSYMWLVASSTVSSSHSVKLQGKSSDMSAELTLTRGVGNKKQKAAVDIDSLSTKQEATRQQQHLVAELEMLQVGLQESEAEAAHRARTFTQEVQALKDSHDIRVRSLQSDLSMAREERDSAIKEKELATARAEGQVGMLQEELRQEHQQLQEIEQQYQRNNSEHHAQVSQLEGSLLRLRSEQEDLSASGGELSVSGASEERSVLVKQLHDAQHNLLMEKVKYASELARLRDGLDTDASNTAQSLLISKIQQLEDTIQNMQSDYEQELSVQKAAHRREVARSKDDMLSLLATAEAKSIHIDEETVRKRYTQEIGKIKDMYSRGYATMEKSHQRSIMELRAAHKKELDHVRHEKDQLLAEETKATQAALDAMRKAHEAELQKERNKFLDAITKTYSQADVQSIQRQHEDDLDFIQNEMQNMTEQLTLKCLENASIEERLEVQTRALHDSRRRTQELLARNEELATKLKHEIAKLTRLVTHQNTPYNVEETPEVYDLKVALQLKIAEIDALGVEQDGLSNKLQATTEELEDSMEQYHSLYAETHQERLDYEHQINRLKQRLVDQSAMLGESSLADKGEPGITVDSLEFSMSEREVSPVTSTPRTLSNMSRTRDSSPGSEGTSTPSDGPGTPRSQRRAALRTTSPHDLTSDGRASPSDPRSNRKALWRIRHPQRSHSSPGLDISARSLSLPHNHPLDSGMLPTSPSPEDARHRNLERHRTTMGINVSKDKF